MKLENLSDEEQATMIILPFKFFVVGDLSYLMLQGRKTYCTKNCLLCQSKQSAWENSESSFTLLSQDYVNTLRKRDNPKQNYGFTSSSDCLLSNIEFSAWICPLLHIKLGLVSIMVNSLYSHVGTTKTKRKIDDTGNENKECDEDSAPENRELDLILQKRGIVRQKYHNNSLIGNHCDRFLENYQIIINEIQAKFGDKTFYQNLSDVAHVLNCIFPILSRSSTTATDEDCEILDALCHRFGLNWRKLYDNTKLTPKFHLLEKHVPKQFRMYGFLADFNEEQVEKLHQIFKNNNRTYKNIANWEKRTRLVINRLYFSCSFDCRNIITTVIQLTACKKREKTKKKEEEVEQNRTANISWALKPIIETITSYLN